ncbi:MULTISPECIES: DUF2256 domain-containing protein [Limnobacter]|uniref:DUF2256 domain-containing protein n=1 Tax=Limnobacter TaxID=131079 RepID=UPI0023B1EABE|nr:DUF2256 domain-containing protein [Limnobacter sp. P1]MDZ4049473.1 DUF2256 domain-containing protein [Limnobacter sp.]
MSGKQQTFKGNKSYLPSKPCTVCGKDMTWRKSWAKNWDDVKYCSDACRKAAPRRTSGK